MYPTPQEQAVINEAEKIMIETMARYDPSHDQYHGERNLTSAIEKCTDQLEFRVTERVSIQSSASAKPP